jgi:hypothetical protein
MLIVVQSASADHTSPDISPFATINCHVSQDPPGTPTITGYGMIPNWSKIEAYGNSTKRYLWNRMKWYSWDRLSGLRGHVERSYEPDVSLVAHPGTGKPWIEDNGDFGLGNGITYMWSNITGAYIDASILDFGKENLTVGAPWSGNFIIWNEYWSLIEGLATPAPWSGFKYKAQRGERWPVGCGSTWCVWQCNNPDRYNNQTIDIGIIPGCRETTATLNSNNELTRNTVVYSQTGACP